MYICLYVYMLYVYMYICIYVHMYMYVYIVFWGKQPHNYTSRSTQLPTAHPPFARRGWALGKGSLTVAAGERRGGHVYTCL